MIFAVGSLHTDAAMRRRPSRISNRVTASRLRFLSSHWYGRVASYFTD
jgi:hypothetical protein